MGQSSRRQQNIPVSGSKENDFQIFFFFNHKRAVMAINVLGGGQTCPVQAQAIPALCCSHPVVEADGGSHHVCSAADDLEGKIVRWAALLVPALVPRWLLACKGGVELEAMALAPGGDTSCVLKGLSRAVTGAHWATKGATPGPASRMKETCPGAGTSFLFEVYGAKTWGGMGWPACQVPPRV